MYVGAVPKILRKRKLAWYDYLFIAVAVFAVEALRDLMHGLELSPLFIFPALGGGFGAGYLARYVAKRLSWRFPALKSKHNIAVDHGRRPAGKLGPDRGPGS